MQFLNWIADHWQTLGAWMTGLVVLWRIGKFLTNIGAVAVGFFANLAKAENTLELLATNHLPHLQLGLTEANEGIADIEIMMEKNNELLSGIREDLRVLLRDRE